MTTETTNKKKQAEGIRFIATAVYPQFLNPSKAGEFNGKIIDPKYTGDFVVTEEKFLKKLKEKNVGIAIKKVSKGQGLSETIAASHEKLGFPGAVYRASKPVYYTVIDEEGKETKKKTIPPKVVGENMEWPKDKAIGNGSKVLVEARLRWDETNKCNRLNLQRVKVLEHVPYESNIKFDDDEIAFDEVKGVSLEDAVEGGFDEADLDEVAF